MFYYSTFAAHSPYSDDFCSRISEPFSLDKRTVRLQLFFQQEPGVTTFVLQRFRNFKPKQIDRHRFLSD